MLFKEVPVPSHQIQPIHPSRRLAEFGARFGEVRAHIRSVKVSNLWVIIWTSDILLRPVQKLSNLSRNWTIPLSASIMEMLKPSHLVSTSLTQCENVEIFLSLRFYVKSMWHFDNFLEPQLQFFVRIDFTNFWSDGNIFKLLHFLHVYFMRPPFCIVVRELIRLLGDFAAKMGQFW